MSDRQKRNVTRGLKSDILCLLQQYIERNSFDVEDGTAAFMDTCCSVASERTGTKKFTLQSVALSNKDNNISENSCNEAVFATNTDETNIISSDSFIAVTKQLKSKYQTVTDDQRRLILELYDIVYVEYK